MCEPSPSEMLQALRDRVDAFFADVTAKEMESIHCRRGCDACCYVDLTVGPAEAQTIRRTLQELDEEASHSLLTRAAREPHPSEDPSPCVMLGSEGGCAIYAHRPMICRTQGLALRYPAGLIHPDALSAKGSDGSDLSWCPLNYRQETPSASTILDATRVDTVLAKINSIAARDEGIAPETRVHLRDLVDELRKGV